MKIQYQDYDAVANVLITSTVFEFRKNNRVVDATLLCTAGNSFNPQRRVLHEIDSVR
ncbi:Uncharacterised protein [Enterobacter cloacae]|nr:Uncharacterised protein [Enterobacter hormaechei]SAH09197.1 Uncharacterised protein [Enterobacter cloacae]